MPGAIRSRDRVIGAAEPVVARYERAAFRKDLLAPPGKPPAAFLCPGHPTDTTAIPDHPESGRVSGDLESKAQEHAVTHLVPLRGFLPQPPEPAATR